MTARESSAEYGQRRANETGRAYATFHPPGEVSGPTMIDCRDSRRAFADSLAAGWQVTRYEPSSARAEFRAAARRHP